MDDEIVVKVNNVSKDFILLHERSGTVKGIFTSMFRKVTTKKEIQHALKDISLEIKKGEFFGIVGRNGSGKSTLLKILAGIYQPTKGSVTTVGKLVPFIELGVGFNPELSGKDNVYLNGAMLGFSKDEVASMYEDIVSFAELERFMDQKLKNYSSGMQVRLAFSMATRAKADILLVDEVLAVGDGDFQRKCYDYFRTLKRTGKTVVFVSHDMGAISEFCDRAALIDKNEIVAEGKPSRISNMYNQMFIESKGNGQEDKSQKSRKRWGNQKVIIKNFTFEKSTFLDSDKHITIKLKLKPNSPHKDLMTGFQVKNGAGQLLHGTNTWIEKIKLPEISKDKTLNVKWTFPNFYSDGLYSVDLYVYGRDNEVLDFIEDAKKFRVMRLEKTSFLIQPLHKFEVEHA